MRKKILLSIIILSLIFITTKVSSLDIYDPNSGYTTSGGSYGSGAWNSSAVAIKVTIIDNYGNIKDAEVFSNGKAISGARYFYGRFSSNFSVHTDIGFMSYLTSWTNWKGTGKIINFYDVLSRDNYYNLKVLINSGYLSVGAGDYIIVEPMAKISTSFGTAYELANAYEGSNNFSCSWISGGQTKTSKNFNTCYNSALFKNNSSIFYSTIYLNEQVVMGNKSLYSATSGNKTVKDYKNSTFGRGIGVFRYNDIYPEGNFWVKKLNSKNEQITGNKILEFDLYNGYWCSGAPIKKVTYTLKNNPDKVSLAVGNYSLKETSAPSGYEMSEACVNFQIVSQGTTEVSLTNTQTCQSEFNSYTDEEKKDPSIRIELYQKYDFKNLLDFDNISTPCNTTNNCNISPTVGCLSGTIITNINERNLSCYTETINLGTTTGYCGIQLDLSNNFNGVYSFTPTYSFTQRLSELPKSGQMILMRTFDTKEIAKVNITKKCYVYGNNITDTKSIDEKNSNYSDYVNGLNFNNEKLDGRTDTTSWILNSYSNYIYLEKKYAKAYYANLVYSKIGTGEIIKQSEYNSYCVNPEDSNDSVCKKLGYGFVGNLDSKSGEFNVPYSLNITTEISSNAAFSSDNKCTYEISNDIVTNDDLNIKFRIIDTLHPFPGRNGLERDTKTNWCDTGNCKSDNDIVTNEIINSNNSYNKNGGGAIYTNTTEARKRIVLTPKLIQDIRNYNKTTTYDDYDKLQCTDGSNCKSTFLKDVVGIK